MQIIRIRLLLKKRKKRITRRWTSYWYKYETKFWRS